jgi:hypothetical protein
VRFSLRQSDQTPAAVESLSAELATVREQVDQVTAHNEWLTETLETPQLASIAESHRDLEMDDRGWRALTTSIEQEFTPEGRVRVVEACRLMSIANPLLKRGLNTRIGYIWGQGVEITARVTGADGKADKELQDAVNQVIDQFIKVNQKSFTGMGACEEKERALGTDGEVFYALFTDIAAGMVRPRSVPDLEIRMIVSNPDDSDEPWFYLREWTEERLPKEGQTIEARETELHRRLYPALGFDPMQAGLGRGIKPKAIQGIDVAWDAPMVHLPVNRLDGWDRGIPDVYASVVWARFYQEFLIDWAGLTKAYSKIAWAVTGNTKAKAANAGAKIRTSNTATRAEGGNTEAGATAVMGPGNKLEAVSKSGATIDSESGKPLAAMVAAGLGLPVTVLLTDPGSTGARAVAETLDLPTILEMGMRRLLWQSVYEGILDHAIATAAMSPGGRALRGVEPVLEFTWPPLAGLDPVKLVEGIVSASTTEVIPELTIARLLLGALGVPNVDEILAELTDDEGNFVPPRATADATAGQAAVDEFRRGGDPARTLA